MGRDPARHAASIQSVNPGTFAIFGARWQDWPPCRPRKPIAVLPAPAPGPGSLHWPRCPGYSAAAPAPVTALLLLPIPHPARPVRTCPRRAWMPNLCPPSRPFRRFFSPGTGNGIRVAMSGNRRIGRRGFRNIRRIGWTDFGRPTAGPASGITASMCTVALAINLQPDPFDVGT